MDSRRPPPRQRRRRTWPPTSESLPDRHIDGDLRLTRPATERRRDVEAHRPEIGVIARADTGTEAQVGEGRGRAAIDLARIEEADHPEIAEAIARLDRRFVDAAAAERVEKIGREAWWGRECQWR